jgi:uncharacterized coiled-coil DUF342 family protein
MVETTEEATAVAPPQDQVSFDVVVDETSPPENDAGGDGQAAGAGRGNGSRKGKKVDRREPKEQVPIEELYDLSKPIKRVSGGDSEMPHAHYFSPIIFLFCFRGAVRLFFSSSPSRPPRTGKSFAARDEIMQVERPSKEDNDAEIAAIESAVDAIRAESRVLQTKIDLATGKGSKQGKGGSPGLGRERDILNKLKNRKGLMIEQKRQIRTRLEAVKADADKLIGQTKSARSGMKFTKKEDIEKEISRLQRRQETSSMSLADEKKLIKEIEALQASKRTAEELQSKQGNLDSIKEDRKTIQADLAAKDKEIDSIQRQIDEQAKVVKELVEKQSTKRGEVDDLVRQRDELKTTLDEKFKEKNDLRAQFYERTNDWYQNQRAVKAQQQLEYDKEKKRRDEEREAWLKRKEEEELAKIPYEEEMALCDYLTDYLTKMYLGDTEEELAKRANAAEEKAKADVVAVKDDPFAGFKAVSKKDEGEIVYFGKGKGEKKSKPKPKKAVKPVAFSLNLDLFDQFGMISLAPPTNLDAVSASVDELRSKKKWYSEQPRGSVPTARDIRKANEEAAAKARGGGSGKAGRGGGNNNGGNKANFDISNDPDFVPLGSGAGGGGGANATWGQKAEDDAVDGASS